MVATFQEVSQIEAAERKIRQNLYGKGMVTRYTFRDILTRDPQMKRLIKLAKDYAKTNATILIQGESGTGKELFAQSIHAYSPRAQGPFVAINCSALPPPLLESELSAMWRARSPGRNAAEKSACLKWPTMHRSSLTKSVKWTGRCRPDCCGCWKSVRSCGWDRIR